MTAPKRTQPTPAAQPEVGLSEEEREALMDACPVTICATVGEHDDLFAAVARTKAEARAAGAADALTEAAEALNKEGLSFKPGGWGSNPADQQTIDALVNAVNWLRDRAAALRAESGGPGQPAGKSEGLDDAGPVPCGSSPRRQDPAESGTGEGAGS